MLVLIFMLRSGYCQWRDYQRPKKILQNICFQNGLELPEYAESSVRIGPKVFEIDPNEGNDRIETCYSGLLHLNLFQFESIRRKINKFWL